MASIDLNHAATVLAQAALTADAISLVVVGVQLFMCTFCLTTFLESSKEARKGRVPYLVVMILLFIIPTITMGSSLSFTFKTTFFASTPADFFALRNTSSDWFGFASAVLMLDVVNLLGDGLMLYRCYIIWSDALWVLALPVACCITAFVFSILSFLPLKDNIALGITDVTYVSLWALTSVATNLSVTGLIASRLIVARRRIAALNPGRDMSAYNGVVSILIESAVPLSVLGIAYAVNLANTKPRNSPEVGKESASYILSSLYFSFMSLSPQMIIFRVTTGKSWANRKEQTETGSAGVSNALVFARSNARGSISSVRSVTDPEAGSPEEEKNRLQSVSESH